MNQEIVSILRKKRYNPLILNAGVFVDIGEDCQNIIYLYVSRIELDKNNDSQLSELIDCRISQAKHCPDELMSDYIKKISSPLKKN